MSARANRLRRRVAIAVAAYRELERRLTSEFDRRYPKLYDARHAATGIGRALWPVLGPLLTALILLPIVVLISGLVALLTALIPVLGLELPSVGLPSIDLPEVPLPDVTPPGWLRAIGSALGAGFGVLADISRYLFPLLVVGLGVYQTRQVRRKRVAAEQIGRQELQRRLAVALGAVQARACDDCATTIGDLSVRRAPWD